MSFLITGATGFIGKKVVKALIAQGHKVAVLTRSVATATEVFAKYPDVKIIDQNEFLSGRLKIDTKTYNKAINLAWADVKNYMDEQNLDENLEFQKLLVTKIVEAGVTDFTGVGTCLEYGIQEGACKENDEVKEPIPTSYAKAKNSLYLKLLDLQKTNPQLSLKWLRFFYIYGVEQRPNSLLRQLLKAIENKDAEFNMSMGDQRRDFINVETLAHNIAVIANQNKCTGIINVGNGRGVSVLEFVEKVLLLKNYKIKLNKGFYPYASYEPKAFWADTTKLRTIEGIKFDEAIWL